MEISKFMVTEANKPKELNRAEVMRMRQARYAQITDEQLAACRSRKDVARCVGILSDSKGASYVHQLIKSKQLIEEKRPDGVYYRKPYHKRAYTSSRAKAKDTTVKSISKSVPTVRIIKGDTIIEITGLSASDTANLVKILGVI